MHITRRVRTALTVLSLALAVIAVAGSPPARADIPTVSPGDRIEYLSPTADVTMFCTVGYVYTGRDLHTYAVTAGHCRGKTAGYARATRTGLTGDFTRAIVEPPYQGGPDYGLIDFGIRSLPLAYIGDTPTTNRHPQPEKGQQVCRTGVSSGQHCGAITGYAGKNQYLTTGMPASIPGDSGGPVWLTTATGSAEIIGIWLGEKTTTNGQEHGRFASLADGLQLLN